MQRLKEAAEKAKIELSGVTTSNINLPSSQPMPTGPKHLDMTLTRAKFNELTADLVEAHNGPCPQGSAGCRSAGSPTWTRFLWSAVLPESLLFRTLLRS